MLQDVQIVDSTARIAKPREHTQLARNEWKAIGFLALGTDIGEHEIGGLGWVSMHPGLTGLTSLYPAFHF